jgi:hypothetical protein
MLRDRSTISSHGRRLMEVPMPSRSVSLLLFLLSVPAISQQSSIQTRISQRVERREEQISRVSANRLGPTLERPASGPSQRRQRVVSVEYKRPIRLAETSARNAGQRPARKLEETGETLQEGSARNRVGWKAAADLPLRSQPEKFFAQAWMLLGEVQIAHLIAPGLRADDLGRVTLLLGSPAPQIRNQRQH